MIRVLIRSWYSLLSSIWGKDVFISYSRADGNDYATALASELAGRDYTCVFDQWETEPGQDIPQSVLRALRMSRSMVLLVTERAGQSSAVSQEVTEFLKTGRQIVPIDIDGSCQKALWWSEVEGLAVAVEAGNGDDRPVKPRSLVVDRIENLLTFQKRDKRLRSVAAAVVSLVIAMSIIALIFLNIAAQNLATAQTNTEMAVDRADGAAKEAEFRSWLADRESKRAEAETNKADAARKRADVASKLASAQMKLAEISRQRANHASKLAERAQIAQKNSVAALFMREAEEIKDKSPIDADSSYATALAFASHQLVPAVEKVEIIRELILDNNPIWRHIDIAHDSPVILTKNLEYAAIYPKENNEIDHRKEDHFVTLLNIESKDVVDTFPVRDSSVFPIFGNHARDYFVVANRDTSTGLQNYDIVQIDQHGFQPLLQKPALGRDIDCAVTVLVCYYFNQYGQLRSISNGGQPQKLFQIENHSAVRLHASPSGKKVALLLSEKLVVADGNEQKHWSVGEFDVMQDHKYEIRWSHDGGKLFLVPPQSSNSLELFGLALDGSSGLQKLDISKHVPSGMRIAGYDFSNDLTQVFLSLKSRQGFQSRTKILDIALLPSGKFRVTGESNLYARNGSQSLYREPPLSFSKDGSFVADIYHDGFLLGSAGIVKTAYLDIYDLDDETKITVDRSDRSQFLRKRVYSQQQPAEGVVFSDRVDKVALWNRSNNFLYLLKIGGNGEKNKSARCQSLVFVGNNTCYRLFPNIYSGPSEISFVADYGNGDIRKYNIDGKSEQFLKSVPSDYIRYTDFLKNMAKECLTEQVVESVNPKTSFGFREFEIVASRWSERCRNGLILGVDTVENQMLWIDWPSREILFQTEWEWDIENVQIPTIWPERTELHLTRKLLQNYKNILLRIFSGGLDNPYSITDTRLSDRHEMMFEGVK